jgi:hypothetical protein
MVEALTWKHSFVKIVCATPGTMNCVLALADEMIDNKGTPTSVLPRTDLVP